MIVCKECQGPIYRKYSWRCYKCNPDPLFDPDGEAKLKEKATKMEAEAKKLAESQAKKPRYLGNIVRKLPVEPKEVWAPEPMRTLAEVERDHVIAALINCRENKKLTAEMLGISLKGLYNRLAAYGLYEQKQIIQ